MAIVAAFRNGETKVYTKSAHQHDKGQRLIITGITLPDTYDVHISNDKEGGMAISLKGDLEGVFIPDEYFLNGDFIYVWIYAIERVEVSTPNYTNEETEESSEEEQESKFIDEGTTVYEIVIPVIKRSVQIQISPKASQAQHIIGYIVDENNALVPVIQ